MRTSAAKKANFTKRNGFDMKFYLIITYPGTDTQVLMHMPKADDNRAVGATEENKDLLMVMGQRLLEENIISSYQLVQTVGMEQNQFTQSADIA
jgi:hypothetical protein